VNEELSLLPARLSAHLGLTLVALLVGVVVSVPLGVLVSRVRRLEAPVLGAASVAQTVPSLALLAFMVPALAALGVRSIGFLPALIGLSIYSVLPILRNTAAGLSGIDPALIEAAQGVGMTPRERLFRVELPLAAPVIVAGIRTSAVWTVGTATLSTPVGAQSLGDYIFGGLQTRNNAAVLIGCLASAALALTLDGLVRVIEIGLRRRGRGVLGLGLFGLVALGALAVAPVVRGLGRGGEAPVVIGAKGFTEQYILSRILAGRVSAGTGLSTETLDSLGSTVAFDALRAGQIDVYVDYTGTIWATVMKRGEVPSDRKEVLREVTQYLEDEHGIVVACSLGFENTYAIAMRRADAARLGIRRLGDLAAHARSMAVGGDYEIFHRPEWRALETGYGLRFGEQRSMDPSLLYEAARGDGVDAITAFSTDARIVSYDLVVLEDDRHVIPPYDAVVLVSARAARERPQVVEALRGLEGAIDADTMRRMNVAVDEKKETPAKVAERFLRERR
jgi:osmoprotectant transport system permease protein